MFITIWKTAGEWGGLSAHHQSARRRNLFSVCCRLFLRIKLSRMPSNPKRWHSYRYEVLLHVIHQLKNHQCYLFPSGVVFRLMFSLFSTGEKQLSFGFLHLNQKSQKGKKKKMQRQQRSRVRRDYVMRERLHRFCLMQTSRSGTLASHILVMKMHNLKELRPSCSSAVQSCVVSVRTSVDGKLCSPERAPLHSIVNRWIKLISLCTVSEWLHTFCRGRDVIAQHVRSTLKGF